MSDYLPRYKDGDTVPVTVGAGGITGGQLINTTGVLPSDADVKVAGVAGQDGAQNAIVTVFRSGLHIATASGSIANGDPICAAASGKVRTWVAGTDPVAARIGRAWSAATNNTAVTYSLFGV